MNDQRDYNLLGESGRRAVDCGLSAARWYRTPIKPDELKPYTMRSDKAAVHDTIILIGAMLLSATGGILFWPTLVCVPFWIIYGVLYGSAMDSRWHECGHKTAFKTGWMNEYVYQLASFMMIRNPVIWRWSHFRHHRETIVVGRDPEIVATRPPALFSLLIVFIGIKDAWQGWAAMLRYALFNKLNAEERSFIPEAEHPAVIRVARIWCAIYAAVILLAVALQSFILLMLVGLPRLYGAWHHVLTGILQHAGLADNVIDHRLNSRTVYMNPVSRFIYWNMNYHVEHHMFPTVPYHQLPALHDRIKDDLPSPNKSIWNAYSEVIPALLEQRKNPDFYLERKLPVTAQPYKRFHNPASVTVK